MNNNNYAVIMAGGIGSRFWPMSKESRPNQFIDILGTGETLIQQNAGELAAVIVDPISTGAGFTLPVDNFLTQNGTQKLSRKYIHKNPKCYQKFQIFFRSFEQKLKK